MNIRVLIVEDDPMVADINKKYTQAVANYTVVGLVRNGGETLAAIEKLQPDLIILDNYLPEQSGLDILTDLRRQDKPVDVIMITAADDTVTVSKAIRHGVVAYITKPFKFQRYQAVLEAYRDLRLELGKKKVLNQEAIDRLTSIGASTAKNDPEELPKSFQAQTKDLIMKFLLAQQQPRSAEQIAVSAGISRVTARRYLELMVEQGQVERTLDYLTVGRPVHRFLLKR
mgnify:CR=1 FL=1